MTYIPADKFHPASYAKGIEDGRKAQEELDREVQAAIAGTADEKDDDESTWHEDPDPTHRGFDWHLLFIGLALCGVLAWSAHKHDQLRLNTQGDITCSTPK